MFPALRAEVRGDADICTRGWQHPSVAIGKFLMNTLSLAPKVSPADFERMFNTHIQDVLLGGYLANTIGTQIDLPVSNRLGSANLGATAPTPVAAATNTTATSATPATGGK